MNQVYKVKKNRHGNTVACSELAKSHSSTVTKALAAVSVMAVAGAAQAVEIGSPQWIDIGSDNTVANAGQSTSLRPALEYAIGDNNKVDGSAALRYNSMTDKKPDGSAVTAADLGKAKLNADGSQAYGQLGALAIGSNNTAQGGQSVTISFNNDTSAVKHEAITVIGSDNKITGYSEANIDRKIRNAAARGVTLTREEAMLDNEGTIIIGDENTAEISKSQILIAHKGSMTGESQNAVGIGDETKVKDSNQAVTVGRATKALDSHGAVAIGSTATVTQAYGGVSIGVAALTDTANGVALGSFSEAHRAAIPSDKVSTFGEGASVAANQVYALHIANDQDKADIEATVKGAYGAVSVGNDKATRQITNVAAGTADSDAVNVAQLQATNNVVAKHEGDIINLGDRLTVAEGDISQLQIDVKAAKTEVKAGQNTTVSQTTGSNGQTIYAVDAKQNITNVAAGSNAVNVSTVTTTAGNTTTNNVKVDLSDRSKDAIDKALTALQEVKVNVNGQQVSTINQSNPQVGFEQGKNIQLTTNSKGEVVVATKDVVDFKTVNVGPVKVDSTTGINAGDLKITGVKAGTAPTDAVNVSQLEKAKADLTNYTNVKAAEAKTEVKAGENVSIAEAKGANGQSVYTVSAKDVDYRSVAGSDAITIKNGTATKVDGTTVTIQTVDLSDKVKESLAKADSALQDVQAGDNIVVTKNGNVAIVATNPDLKQNSITLGGDVYISGDKVDVAGNQINNVKAGEAPTDAVNVSQLESATAKATTEVKAGTHTSVTKEVGSNGQTIYTVNGKDTAVDSGSKSVAVTSVFDPKTNTTTATVGLTDRAEKGIDLAHTALQTTETSIDGQVVNVLTKDDNRQNFVSGSNVTLSTDANGSVVVATKDNVKFDTVEANQYKSGDVTIAGDKVDVAGNQITNVAKGTKGTDAVNVNQLNVAAAKATTEVVAGTHTSVTKAVGDAGQAIYTVNGKDTVVKAGSESIAVSNVFDAATNTTTSTVGLTAHGEEGIKLAHTAVQSTQISIDGKVVNVLTKDNNRQEFTAGKNVKLSTDSKGAVVIGTQDDVEFQNVVAKSFRSGDVHISETEVNAGGNKVTNVAPGTISATSTDAVNGSQLHQTNQNVTNLDNKVNNIFGDMQSTMDEYKKDLSAGIAGVNAAAALPGPHRAGQSAVSAAVGYYGSQSALAIGVGAISDSGRWTVRGQANINTRGDLGAGVGVSYNF